MPNCRGGGLNCKFFEKTLKFIYIIIIREWFENTPPPPSILRNLDNFLPDAFYLILLQLDT